MTNVKSVSRYLPLLPPSLPCTITTVSLEYTLLILQFWINDETAGGAWRGYKYSGLTLTPVQVQLDENLSVLTKSEKKTIFIPGPPVVLHNYFNSNYFSLQRKVPVGRGRPESFSGTDNKFLSLVIIWLMGDILLFLQINTDQPAILPQLVLDLVESLAEW